MLWHIVDLLVSYQSVAPGNHARHKSCSEQVSEIESCLEVLQTKAKGTTDLRKVSISFWLQLPQNAGQKESAAGTWPHSGVLQGWNT